MSKGDKRVPESKSGNYAQGYDRIFTKPATTCPVCSPEICGCMPTEDGPGTDEASKEVKTNYERRNFEGDL